MPTLATGIPNRQNGRGFTLIEVLVVVLIVSIIFSVVVLSLGLLGDDRELQTEGRRFASLLEVSQDEATLQGREFGVEFLNQGYRFVEFDAQTQLWADVPNDELLRLRPLPEDVLFELFLEDQRVLLDDDPAPFEYPNKSSGISSGETYTPHLLIFSSGDATPFEVHLVRDYDEQRVIIRGDALGDVTIGDETEEEI